MHKLTIIGLLIVVIAGISAAYFASNSKTAKCPEDHQTSADAAKAFDEWIEEYRRVSPEAQYPEIRQATIQMYLHQRCKAALQRIAEQEERHNAGSSLETMRAAALGFDP